MRRIMGAQQRSVCLLQRWAVVLRRSAVAVLCSAGVILCRAVVILCSAGVILRSAGVVLFGGAGILSIAIAVLGIMAGILVDGVVVQVRAVMVLRWMVVRKKNSPAGQKVIARRVTTMLQNQWLEMSSGQPPTVVRFRG